MIQLNKVKKSYGSLEVVKDLSLEISRGAITVLIGPSGCGKTTTLEMINGLIPPDSGEILVDGVSVGASDLVELRRRIGYVIQEVGLFPHYTVFDNIAVVPRLLHWDKERVEARVGELLKLVNLPENRLRMYPAQLSGGQQQRVGVARALAADPEYLLMDEPFSALDPINRARLQDEFSSIQAHLKKTVVFVTHDMDEGLKLGDRIAVFNQGRLLQYDTPVALLRRPVDEFVSRFIGQERLLRILRLLRVSDLFEQLPQRETPVIDGKASPAEALAVMQRNAADFIFLLDRHRQPLSWTKEAELRRAISLDQLPRRELNKVTLQTSLQSVVESFLASTAPAFVIVDEQDNLQGFLTLRDIQNLLTIKRSE